MTTTPEAAAMETAREHLIAEKAVPEPPRDSHIELEILGRIVADLKQLTADELERTIRYLGDRFCVQQPQEARPRYYIPIANREARRPLIRRRKITGRHDMIHRAIEAYPAAVDLLARKGPLRVGTISLNLKVSTSVAKEVFKMMIERGAARIQNGSLIQP